MITNQLFYGVKCDRCGEIHEDSDYTFYSDEGRAVDSAMDDEWTEVNGKHYCPNCYVIDSETDEATPKPNFPDYVKLIRKFLNSMVKCYERGIEEKDGAITLNYSLFNTKRLPDYDSNYIDARFGSNIIAIVYIEELTSTKVFITIKL